MINPEYIQPKLIEPIGPLSNNNDKFFSEDIAMRLPDALRSMAKIMLICGIVIVILCFKNRNGEGNQQSKSKQSTLIENQDPSKIKIDSIEIKIDRNKILIKAMRHKSFVVAFINNTLTHGTGILICSLYQSQGFKLD